MDHASTSPRARSRGFSFRSDKSGGSKGKVDLTESPEDKARRDSIWKTSSKANPNAALNEAQPGVLNLTETTTLQSLRTTQHKDVNGNLIADPDLSNPTRPRLERPLDTIRSFERAIDNGYKRRSSYNNGHQGDVNRRSSYMGVNNVGYDSSPSPGRHSAMGGYYGDRRPGSYYDGGNGGQRQRYSGNRGFSEGNIQRPYPQHNYDRSQDTMHTGGSDSTGPWANSTDPSSENSSIDRNVYGSSGYGQNGYGHPNIMEEGAAGPAYGGPVQAPPSSRKPIPLGSSTGTPIDPPKRGSLPATSRPEPEKKKGWLKRRFSKKE